MSQSHLVYAPTIVFSGERSENHYVVAVSDKPIQLTHACLEALVELVLARQKSVTGYVPISRVCIRRLRESLNGAGPNLGRMLIETGCGEEYRLRLPKDSLAKEISVDPSFLELGRMGALCQEQVEQLARFAEHLKPSRNGRRPMRNRGVTEKKPSGN